MQKNKCLFLDRDGVINVDINRYITSIYEIQFYPPIFEIAYWAKQKDYKIVVITNQAGISRGLQSYEEVEEVHLFIQKEFNKRNLKIDKFYYCPHHPDFSKCFCRKPGTLNFEKAIAEFDINPLHSIMLGDNIRDILPAKKLGIPTILIHPLLQPTCATFQLEKLEDTLPLLRQVFL
ncbi:MAG: HAD-IIIA family hydrolase [Bacteroidia bacterium]|nr:HAD-IIIA family hydrolase [Bacteroidia bacterium]MDW8157338.1 HAD-IIIA family hydrolase [Bacteroidia bacterium]